MSFKLRVDTLSLMTRPRIFVVGSANVDLVLRVPRFPNPGETITAMDLSTFPGGKGANQACAAARLGGEVCFVGCVGPDSFGTLVMDNLQNAGVDISRIRKSERPTGCASIYVEPGGQNSIVISPGANADLRSEHVCKALDDLSPLDFVLLQLEVPLKTVAFTLEIVRAAGATSILDPAPGQALDREVLASVDTLTPNQTEAGILLGLEGPIGCGDDELMGTGFQYLTLGANCVICKLAEHGCAIFDNKVQIRIDGFRVDVIDTTAAGDVYNGALAIALLEGRSRLAAAQFANAAAALSVTRSGAQPSIPDRVEVEDFIRSETLPAVWSLSPRHQ